MSVSVATIRRSIMTGTAVILSIAPKIALAGTSVGLSETGSSAGLSGYAGGDIYNIATIVIKAALSIVGVVYLILLIGAGFMWMTAQGSVEQVDKAKKMLVSATIGLVIVLSAYSITTFITSTVVDVETGAVSAPEQL